MAAPDPSQVALETVERALAGEVAQGATVVLGTSGGPDSAGLLALVCQARPDLHVVAAHVRHGLRDDEPDADAARSQAAIVGVDFVTTRVEVVPVGEGLEAAARDARHAALQDTARDRGAVAVLLGHSADDQAETVLLRLARGTTARGAAGMRPVRPHAGGVICIRPGLSLRRADLHQAAAHAGMVVLHDPTNHDRAHARNVVRADVLPALAEHAGDPAAALARFAQRAGEDDDHLRALARTAIDKHAHLDGDVWVLTPDGLHDAPMAVQRRMVEELLARVRPEAGAVADEVDDILGLAVDRAVNRRGVLVRRLRTSLRFSRA